MALAKKSSLTSASSLSISQGMLSVAGRSTQGSVPSMSAGAVSRCAVTQKRWLD